MEITPLEFNFKRAYGKGRSKLYLIRFFLAKTQALENSGNGVKDKSLQRKESN
uniref:Uncharacterized protein n=1 Tax=Rhizophora mucronata TaxID=61149 RepID=A0A2P2PHY1_RHIMU